jgi:hypothetical protein
MSTKTTEQENRQSRLPNPAKLVPELGHIGFSSPARWGGS